MSTLAQMFPLIVMLILIVPLFATVLSDDYQRTRQQPGPGPTFTIKDNEVLYTGILVTRDSTGEAKAAADVATEVFVGVHYGPRIDNTDDGEEVTPDKSQCFEIAGTGFAATDVGKNLYVVDNNTGGLFAASTNKVYIGRLREFISSTLVVCDPTQAEDLQEYVQVVADPASATSTNGYMASIASALISDVSLTQNASELASLGFSATVTSAEAEAMRAAFVKVASDLISVVSVLEGNASVQGLELAEAEKIGDDVRAVRTKQAAVVDALQAMGLFSAS